MKRVGGSPWNSRKSLAERIMRLGSYPVSGIQSDKGLTNKLMVKTMHQILDSREITAEYLPEEYRNHYQLAEYNYALSHTHFPKDKKDLVIGRKRLVFDEFLFFILSVRMMKEKIWIPE